LYIFSTTIKKISKIIKNIENNQKLIQKTIMSSKGGDRKEPFDHYGPLLSPFFSIVAKVTSSGLINSHPWTTHPIKLDSILQ
jgi:hypothetical protein